jgi:predicted nucleic acid-binding protein
MRAILDTNILIDGPLTVPAGITEVAVTSISYAELRFGIATVSAQPELRIERQLRLDAITESFGEGLPFDDRAALSYGYITELVLGAGRSPRGRIPDLMIAAIALAHGATLITRDGKDFAGIEHVLNILQV